MGDSIARGNNAEDHSECETPINDCHFGQTKSGKFSSKLILCFWTAN